MARRGPELSRRNRARLLVGFVTLVGCSEPAVSTPCTDAKSCRGTLALSRGGSIPVYRSLPLERNGEVRRAVVVVHGQLRDADRYFERLVSAARAEGRLADTALFAPHFRALEDGPAPGELYWSARGWKKGHRSRGAEPVSAFAVMDELLERICPRFRGVFPSLETVVLIGHSAGGQFVNRYTAGGRGCPDAAVEVRYVVMNPSSYIYVDERRRSAATGHFEVPRDPPCGDYDHYMYGLRALNHYMRSVGPGRMRANLFERSAFYIAGERDTGTAGSLDISCPGSLQGPNRLARHANYRAYRDLFPDWKGSVFEVVPGVGHHGGEMLMSGPARRVAFR